MLGRQWPGKLLLVESGFKQQLETIGVEVRE